PSAGARYIDYCPDGWSYYKLNCFKYFPDVRTWDEAEEAATLRKSISYYQRVQSVWVGLRYKKESRTWQWPSGDHYTVSNGLDGNGA
ncbi:Regenerating islet-derived protein 4, partial [Acanthisitta chloris]